MTFDPNAPAEIGRIAELIGISKRRVDQILAAADVARIDRGKVPLRPALQACLRSYRDSLARRRARSAGGEQLLAAKAHEIEQRNARTEDRLADIEEHREIAAETFALIRRHLADVPAIEGLAEAARNRLAAEMEDAVREAEKEFEELTTEALPGRRAR